MNAKVESKPLFSKGMSVQFNEKKRSELMKYISSTPNAVGPFPTGRLIIWTDPHWCPSKKVWCYEYEYGWDGTHEGSAIETDLEISKKIY